MASVTRSNSSFSCRSAPPWLVESLTGRKLGIEHKCGDSRVEVEVLEFARALDRREAIAEFLG
jgi:hypothetical protein